MNIKQMQSLTEPFVFSIPDLPTPISDKLNQLIYLLNQPTIPLKQLMAITQYGVPDHLPRIREICWKLLLGYLPPSKAKWKQIIVKNQKTYTDFVNRFLPEEKYENYPLVIDTKLSKFKQYQQDYDLWEQIEKDAARTHSDLAFFNQLTLPIMIPFLTGSRRQKFRIMNGDNQSKFEQFQSNKEAQRVTYRYHTMCRILFIYSKLNPKIKYVQGMNEILAPIFYLVNSHKPIQQQEESSCFFMFNNAMSTVIQLHIKDLDESESGLNGKLKHLNNMLLTICPQIWKRFSDLQVDTLFYSFRWITLLYAQQFQMFNVMRLWESIFSRTNRFKYINFVAMAILMINRDMIMKSSFISILQNLQNLKFDSDILQIINVTNRLQQKFNDTNFSENIQKRILNAKDSSKK